MVSNDRAIPITTVLLAGASGYIGRYVVNALLDEGLKIVCLYRSASDIDNALTLETARVVNLIVDLNNVDSFENESKFFPEFHAVISCVASRTGGIKDSWNTEYAANLNLYRLAKRCSVKRFILLSAICVQKPMLHFQKAKLAMENELVSGPVPYTIIRPTAFFKSLAGQIMNVKSGKRFITFDGGEKTSCKPISERDLAKFICLCLLDHSTENKILPIGGPGPALTQKAQGLLLFQLTGSDAHFFALSSRIFTVFQTLVSPFSCLSRRIEDFVEYLRIAYYYATESMLYWDDDQSEYSSEKTPEFGNENLRDFYKKVLKDGMEQQELGDHKLF